ncbi:MAG: retroviral-like aspartic protease family protein, partial [Gammaproteobacteria bacterium]|nr:retroviral-like aspartic protease family protein [Gammaproteobacteria bacterium]
CGTIAAEVSSEFMSFFSHSIPLHETSAGSFSVVATLGGVEGEFLLDTGASLVTVNAEVFKQIRRNNDKVVKVRQVGARLASGKVQIMDIYQVESLDLGYGCDLGPVEVAVSNRGGRNLLGMSALNRVSTFAVTATPPSLALSNCL